MSSILSNFTKEQIQQIVNSSSTKREVAIKLGYSANSGSAQQLLKTYFEQNHIDISNLKQTNKRYTKEEVFIQNGTISQHSLVEWFKKENIPYKCSICGQQPIWNGKPLIMILDHINGIHNDDRLSNLRWVCPNCNYQLDTTGYKKNRVKKLKPANLCIDCGKEISQGSIRCIKCDHQRYVIKIEDMPITREELKQLIRTLPFTQIGEKYNISDNGIRKWCDKFKLPRTKKEINSYSEEEWDKI